METERSLPQELQLTLSAMALWQLMMWLVQGVGPGEPITVRAEIETQLNAVPEKNVAPAFLLLHMLLS